MVAALADAGVAAAATCAALAKQCDLAIVGLDRLRSQGVFRNQSAG